jgi:Leucine-rich repeat (LRR) protein
MTDDALSNLSNLRELRHLAIRRAAITGSGLRHVLGLPKLESLDLDGCPISDSAIVNLQELRNLKKLNIKGTQVSRQGAEILSATLRDCEIEYP